MTREEIWEKWFVKANGGHVPVRLLALKDKFLKDLEKLSRAEWDEEEIPAKAFSTILEDSKKYIKWDSCNDECSAKGNTMRAQ